MSEFIDWKNLKNPIFSHPDFSLKDVCCARKNDWFYLFSSAFDEERSHIIGVKTRDFKTFSDFILFLDGRDFGFTGICSPEILEYNGKFIMALNSWGDDPEKPNQLFYLESEDLENWSELKPLAANLTKGIRAIDAALAFTGKFWALMYRRKLPSVIAYSESLDGPWDWAGPDAPEFVAMEDPLRGPHHENFQFLLIDNHWNMICTRFPPHHPWIYRIKGTGDLPEDWAHWEAGRRLEIPEESFNTVDRDNAAALYDWRAKDGFFYLLYGGKNEEKQKQFMGGASSNPWARGWNKIGIARSKDLKKWFVPGEVE